MNYVAKLNEYGQKEHVKVQYEEKATPDHTKAFTVRAIVNGKRYPEGVGKNKREAKENAALKALGMLPHKESNGFSSSPAKIVQPNYQCWLNEHSQKTGVTYKPIEKTRVGAASTPFCCQYVSNGESYPEGYGESKQKAKEEAAKLAYLALRVKVCSGECGLSSSQDQKWASSVKSTSAAGGKHSRSAPTPSTVFSHTSNAGGKELNFFNKHKAELETRLSTTSVLIQLEGCGILNAVERETVEAERISVSQNHALIVMLSRKGERAQEKFYEILKETDPYLVKDLEKGFCTS
ncbi:interferon-induced, double-stranded RNA-activated protein kinase-like [Alosa pseudoharengus]|uniref:interferon-induced, double-stranded RNA-activated protein kinase-like n=1 Tax=Alosa pseudoharengus TaxID=34774 RepID=UPI003F8869E7